MPLITFTKAQRLGSHVIIAMVGGSDAGKTLSAILLGRGLVGPQGRLALIDTETGRGRIYAKVTDYDYGELTPPFTPERYIEAITDAENAGYGALIIDSASHEWSQEGGTLDIAEAGKTADGKPLKGLVKWAAPKARHGKFIRKILTSRIHLILCLRAKEKMAQKGSEIVSEGWVSVQDKNFIYETTIQLFFDNRDKPNRGVPRIEKCPGDLMAAFPEGQKISIDTGRRIAEWVAGGVPVDAEAQKLKAEAEEAAEGGTAVLEAMWNRLTKDQKRKLSPHMENCKSIARTADEESKPVDEREPGEDVA